MASPASSSGPYGAARLTYSIAGCSEHSHRYVAENILHNSPLDQSSRWSGVNESPNVKQWLLLRLDSLSVVDSITFGKYHKPHPCNMREFKVYVGMTPDHMTEILAASLRDDNTPETFPLRHFNSAGVCFPCRYVKIVPLTAHSHSFHISVWFVALTGTDDEQEVQEILIKHEEYKEKTALRQILKHLRQRRFLAPYKSILASTGVQVEHPLVTQLYESIVSNGSWSEAEDVLRTAASAGLFDAYLQSYQPHAIWRRLYGVDADGDAPSQRGGHTMCIDEDNGLIYLLGGWDGNKSLDDFWAYDIAADRWRLISHSVSQEKGGPGPRSCHKMVFDTKTGAIYVLGGLLEGDNAAEEPAEDQGAAGEEARREHYYAFADFYRYHTRGADAGNWELISNDTAATGGPPLILDHQMVMDSETQTLYVHGGRVNDGDSQVTKYSEFYSYHVPSRQWKLLRPTVESGTPHASITQRLGHSMVFDPNSRMLFIFSGMYGEEDQKYLADMYAYNIDTNVATEVFSNFAAAGGPERAFTKRSVIDPSLQEIYVFCGLTRQRKGQLPRLETTASSWICRYRDSTWMRILPEDVDSDADAELLSGTSEERQPRARYAHQVVYNSKTKTVYLHGGNAGRLLENGEMDDKQTGEDAVEEQRLDDFWSMKLKRPGPDEVIRRAQFQIRCQQFRELCTQVPAVQALKFLQTQVSEVVDHGSSEAQTFRDLLSYLMSAQARPKKRTRDEVSEDSNTTGAKEQEDEGEKPAGVKAEVPQEIFQQRTEVFEKLLKFFPPGEKEPESNLVDMVDWYEESVDD
ncbi:hypothetical protein DENSPDRAFT_839309 [Dentipellis sp. KUC8613]|nr:hypothetical protein DENSPDRAFT_839309 [Dentipellis sp. KUC8613]